MTITRKFRSVAWTAAVATAALSCYLISHRVSAERSALEDVERQIAQTRDDIVALNTEFETRSRMSQIERWSRRDFVLAAPGPAQFLAGEFELASLVAPPALHDGLQLASAAETTAAGAVPGDVFEARDDEAPATPRVQPVAYIVERNAAETPAPQRIAFLDESVRGEIAGLAAAEQGREGDGDE